LENEKITTCRFEERLLKLAQEDFCVKVNNVIYDFSRRMGMILGKMNLTDPDSIAAWINSLLSGGTALNPGTISSGPSEYTPSRNVCINIKPIDSGNLPDEINKQLFEEAIELAARRTRCND
jgi:hypothetical protein